MFPCIRVFGGGRPMFPSRPVRAPKTILAAFLAVLQVALMLALAPLARASGSPSLSISADAGATEPASATKSAVVSFDVVLSGTPSGTVTVDYATADGTATAGLDYEARSGTLTFKAGETKHTVPVTVKYDLLDEPAETFTL